MGGGGGVRESRQEREGGNIESTLVSAHPYASSPVLGDCFSISVLVVFR